VPAPTPLNASEENVYALPCAANRGSDHTRCFAGGHILVYTLGLKRTVGGPKRRGAWLCSLKSFYQRFGGDEGMGRRRRINVSLNIHHLKSISEKTLGTEGPSREHLRHVNNDLERRTTHQHVN